MIVSLQIQNMWLSYDDTPDCNRFNCPWLILLNKIVQAQTPDTTWNNWVGLLCKTLWCHNKASKCCHSLLVLCSGLYFVFCCLVILMPCYLSCLSIILVIAFAVHLFYAFSPCSLFWFTLLPVLFCKACLEEFLQLLLHLNLYTTGLFYKVRFLALCGNFRFSSGFSNTMKLVPFLLACISNLLWKYNLPPEQARFLDQRWTLPPDQSILLKK